MGLIKINNLVFPRELRSVVEQQSQDVLPLNKISTLYPFLNYPMRLLASFDEIKGLSINEYFLNEKFWGIGVCNGTKKYNSLPFLDFEQYLIIAINQYPGEDLVIALDYRVDAKNPRVVASNFNGKYSHCEWVVIFDSSDLFLQKISSL